MPSNKKGDIHKTNAITFVEKRPKIESYNFLSHHLSPVLYVIDLNHE